MPVVDPVFSVAVPSGDVSFRDVPFRDVPFRDVPFRTVLVANRGEIACRVIRTLARLGIRSVAVYSDADRDAPHVRLADVAVRLGPAPAAESYLSIPAVVRAARASGAEAVHPGYGFLSENAAFARACAEAGLVFIGPAPHALEVMGDKIRAKEQVAAAGVPVTPAVAGSGLDDAALIEGAARLGYPLLVKPSAGGGGKGMIEVASADALPEALASARRQAAAAFGDDTLFLERLVTSPRHIEVQVIADAHGGIVHLGERECSLQRRHQKVIEEAPSALLDAETRDRIGRAACAVARSVDYLGAGTVEFIVSDAAPGEFFFMEMNTRLQVEHPVTEMVTGVDLVAAQLRVAAGLPLGLRQEDARLRGHAIEARVYAESPRRGFLPTGGEVLALREPGGAGVRVDGGIRRGQVIGADYDPMLAKVIAWGPDRETARERLAAALGRTRIAGVETNLEYLRLLLADDDVRAGRLDTGLIGRRLPGLRFAGAGTEEAMAAALWRWGGAVGAWTARPSAGRRVPDRWSWADGWRAGEPEPVRVRVTADAAGGPSDDGTVPEESRLVRLGRPRSVPGGVEADVALGDSEPARTARLVRSDDGGGAGTATGTDRFLLEFGGRIVAIDLVAEPAAPAGGALAGGDPAHPVGLEAAAVLWAATDRGILRLRLPGRGGRSAGRAGASGSGAAAGGDVRSPMPGTVVALHAADGQRVEAGAAVATVEAMKMEHRLDAPSAGIVRLETVVGATVAQGDVVARVLPPEEPEEPVTDDSGAETDTDAGTEPSTEEGERP